jgi:hypothetical protein
MFKIISILTKFLVDAYSNEQSYNQEVEFEEKHITTATPFMFYDTPERIKKLITVKI